MANGVDAVDSVVHEYGADEEPPHQEVQAWGVEFGFYVLQGEAGKKQCDRSSQRR